MSYWDDETNEWEQLCTGNDVVHLHFEVSNEGGGSAIVRHGSRCGPDLCVIGNRTTDYDIDTLLAHYGVDANGNIQFGGQVWYNPDLVIDDYKELLPYFSRTRTVDAATFSNYNVYGVADQNIVSSLDSTNDHAQINYFVGERSDITLDNNAQFQNNVQNQGDQEGLPVVDDDYMLFAYINEGQDIRIGYPVKFAFLANQNDRIVDNDQRGNDQNGSSYETTGATGLNVPGYFLTATLHEGRSDDTAEWHPNIIVTGQYNVFVHIPEHGATATGVVYSMGDEDFDSIDHSGHGGTWVQLKDGNKTDFEFDADDYIELDLKNVTDDARSGQMFAFDAIKFEHVAGNNDAEVKLSIGYDQNARKPMAGDKINIECYFKPSGEEDDNISYSIEVDGNEIPHDGDVSETEPFILSATYNILEKNEIEIGCVAGNEKETEKISNIGSYNEPKKENDIKEGDRVTVQSNPINVYTCSPSERGFYTATLIGQAPIGLQGNIKESFFDENGKVLRKILWKQEAGLTLSDNGNSIEWNKIAIGDDESFCIADNDISRFDNPCFFDDFSGKRISVKSDYVNCRQGDNGKIDWDHQVKISSGTFGFSKNNDWFDADGYTWRQVSWYNTNGDTCYSAAKHLNIAALDDKPYFESVGEMCKLGVASGYGSQNNKFGPSNFLTRAEVSKIIVNTANKIPSGEPQFNEEANKEDDCNFFHDDPSKRIFSYYARTADCEFGDVSVKNGLAPYIGKLYSTGIIKGYPRDKKTGIHNFGPNDKVSRGQLTKFIVNAVLIDSSNDEWPDIYKPEEWHNYTSKFEKKCSTVACPFDDADSYGFCHFLYKLENTALPIYDGNTFVDISSKDQSEKSATRGETMKAVYSSFLKRSQVNNTCSLLDCEKSYAESCTQK